MGYLSAERIRAIETALTQHMVQEFWLDLSTVVYDATTFLGCSPFTVGKGSDQIELR